jgi:hypothetical protein
MSKCKDSSFVGCDAVLLNDSRHFKDCNTLLNFQGQAIQVIRDCQEPIALRRSVTSQET